MPTTTKTNDIRKVLTSPTPLYFAAGLIDKLRETAPERLAAVREKAADPKAVQERLAQQAKQTQSKLTAALSGIDTDLKKLRDQAQHLALQGVGLAAEYAVKAREGYGELAERGRDAVQTWRGEKNGAGKDLSRARGRSEVVVVEEEEKKPQARAAAARRTTARSRTTQTGAAKKAAARKTATPRKTTAGAPATARKTAAPPTPKAVAKKETAAKKAAKQTPRQEASKQETSES
ncbi:hypothetical protein [Streptomyces macrosporus]|uniref:Uncharacterized protein n=1 Tax=Streptomyces macrosporus TaxID=44032 RepID=A0ABP5WJN0_9ACTN